MTKAASVFNKLIEWKDNRVEDALYLKYLMEHKYNVLKGGMELGSPFIPLIMHDWSKFKPRNWVPYREYLFGTKYPSGDPNELTEEERQQQYLDFREAVENHIDSESHHDYKYRNPDKSILPNEENKADWWAIQRYYYPDTTPTSIKEWLLKKSQSKM